MTRARHRSAVVACLVLSACASMPGDAGLSEVRRAVVATTGHDPDWNFAAPILEPMAETDLQASTPAPLSADRAVEIVLRSNRDLLATPEGLGVARADLLQARTLRNPFLDAELRFPGEPTRPFEIALVQPLLDLVRLRARRAAGEAAFEVTRLRITGAVLGFAAEVRSDYYTELAARQVLARQTTIAESARAAAELAQRQHEAGNISDLDLDLEREQARYETAKLDLARASLDELLAREALIADLGVVDPQTAMELPAELPAIPSEDPVTEDLDRALTDRFDLRLARAELAAARASLPLARGQVYEDLAVGVHREREPEGARTTGPAVAVPIPIFDTGRARRAGAQAFIRQAEQRAYAVDLAGRSAARAAAEWLREARAAAGEGERMITRRNVLPIHVHGHHFRWTGTDAGPLPSTAWIPETTINVPPGTTRDVDLVADNPGDWALHCHKVHHTMNQMGHKLPILLGTDTRAAEEKLEQLAPGTMMMGQDGMGDMMDMGKPRNTLLMGGGEGPFGPIFMGGMFTVLKVREGLRSYDEDAGWYQHPAGTVASAVGSAHAAMLGRPAPDAALGALPTGTFDAVRSSACGAGLGGR